MHRPMSRPPRSRAVTVTIVGARALLALGSLLLSAGGTAMAAEQPSYRVIQKLEGLEIREYDASLVAETEVSGTRESAGNAGFRVLAAYIFGKNRGEKKLAMTAPVRQAEGQRIAMTAPVTQSRPGGEAGGAPWVVQFMMPSGHTLETLPEPLDPAVHLRQVPARRVAALTYSGTWSERRYLEHLSLLREAMRRAGLQPAGEPVWARYDPPFMPWFLRKNEILIEVAD
jgi:hypothetical protein